eukprot:1415041-Prymnesium_polylepis.1
MLCAWPRLPVLFQHPSARASFSGHDPPRACACRHHGPPARTWRRFSIAAAIRARPHFTPSPL